MEKHEIQRLGKRDLGSHAFEDCMPDKILDILATEADSNNLPDVIPKLAQLLRADGKVSVIYLCHAGAVQIYKLPNEGAHFCGYRNLQTLCLALATNHAVPLSAGAREALSSKLTVLEVQDRIEAAWEAGINSHGRVQTGGIKGTRKHVGSSEAEALLLSLGVKCTGHAFSGPKAWTELLDAVEAYFSSCPAMNADDTSLGQAGQGEEFGESIHITTRPPLFLQRPKHSITIVGIERTVSGKRRLLGFDPAWKPPGVMRKETLTQDDLTGLKAKWVLKLYRKGGRYLRKWKQFEMVCVD
ncbi:hypothetical protein LTR62_002728 [Meristemomyces frigidus]|uniref:UFSP1/2/DUB catalytic domain-containing protein n=1 Tax=Meristemomyces frigidus TaxID=1508187 RepID=A0AAN7YHG4_9PEZI|nr:hypothetical protein LTR62_002728 [Meristemomyces frigidus]